MLKLCLLFGSIAGLVVGIPLFTLTVTHHLETQYGMLIGYLTMLIALSAVFAAIKQHRDKSLGGVIRFWPALLLGLGISTVAGFFYVAAWEIALAVTHLDFADSYAKAQLAQKEAAGASEAELQSLTTEMDEFRRNYANPLYRISETFMEIFPVGLLVSLISAGLLRNSRFLPARKTLAQCAVFCALLLSGVCVQAAEPAGHIIGIGGIFFKSPDPKALRTWYRDVLGLKIESWGGAVFKYDAPNHPPALAWNVFPQGSDFMAPSQRDFMLNFAVDDLDALIAGLERKGVSILKRDDSDPSGKFAWIIDPDGTKIELWEPKAK